MAVSVSAFSMSAFKVLAAVRAVSNAVWSAASGNLLSMDLTRRFGGFARLGCLNSMSSPSLFCLIASDREASSRRFLPDDVLGELVLPALLLMLALALASEVSRETTRGVTGGLPGSAFTMALSPDAPAVVFCLDFSSVIAAPMFKPLPAFLP